MSAFCLFSNCCFLAARSCFYFLGIPNIGKLFLEIQWTIDNPSAPRDQLRRHKPHFGRHWPSCRSVRRPHGGEGASHSRLGSVAARNNSKKRNLKLSLFLFPSSVDSFVNVWNFFAFSINFTPLFTTEKARRLVKLLCIFVSRVRRSRRPKKRKRCVLNA